MPKSKCKTCGKNTDGGEFCFVHKQRKALPSVSRSRYEKDRLVLEEPRSMREFFIHIWKFRPHTCENCNSNLGKEPLSYMFDHVLEKNKYPALKFEENNIMMLCLHCHDNKTRGFLSEKMLQRLEQVKKRFEIE
jgi:5-methylcytosine-specific restriction endonuclease McrA